MARVFDRPTRFTLNALSVKRATKYDLNAAVNFELKGFGSIPAPRYRDRRLMAAKRVKKGFERAAGTRRHPAPE